MLSGVCECTEPVDKIAAFARWKRKSTTRLGRGAVVPTSRWLSRTHRCAWTGRRSVGATLIPTGEESNFPASAVEPDGRRHGRRSSQLAPTNTTAWRQVVAAAQETVEALCQKKNRRTNCQRLRLPRRTNRSAASNNDGNVGDQIASAARGGCPPVCQLAQAENGKTAHNKSVSCGHRVTHWACRMRGRRAGALEGVRAVGVPASSLERLHD